MALHACRCIFDVFFTLLLNANTIPYAEVFKHNANLFLMKKALLNDMHQKVRLSYSIYHGPMLNKVLIIVNDKQVRGMVQGAQGENAADKMISV